MKYRWLGAIVGLVLGISWMLVAWKANKSLLADLLTVMLLFHVGFGYWFGKRYEEMQQMAYHDSLTGSLVHRRFIELLDKEIERAERHQYPVALMFIDLDNFKKYNDKHGHLAGDQLLCRFAEILHVTVRKHDAVGRWGGEEFVILLPHTDKEQAMRVGERIRAKLRNELNGVTVSIGIAAFPDHANSAMDLAARADEWMYEAKKTKDCMVTGS